MRSRRLLGVLAALVLLTGCGGLPLPNVVRDADGAVGGTADDGGIVVVAPGPQRGTTATQLVEDYLYALSRSPQDDHRIARQFLAPDVECCDEGEEAVLYPLGGVGLSVLEDPSVVRASFDTVGRILRDGSFRLEDVRLHGGWLQAAGRPGRGSVFRMTLPRVSGRTVPDTPLEAPR